MNNQNDSSTDGVVSLLAGVAVGVLIGGAVGLLLAPQAGQQTRDRLRESADEAVNWLSGSVDDLRRRVDDLAQNVRQRDAAAELGDAVDSLDISA